MRRVSTIVNCLSKDICGVAPGDTRTYLFGMSSRTLHPLACRVSRRERAAIVAAAARRRVAVSRFIKNLLEPYFDETGNVDSVHASVNNLLSDAAPSRSTLAPANRAPQEPVVSRSGFAERTK